MAVNDITLENGVTKRELSDGFLYMFPLANITTNTVGLSATFELLNGINSPYTVYFDDISEQYSTADIEEYVDYLAAHSFFFRSIVPTSIQAADSPSVDAFSRLRVSGTGQRLDVEFIYDEQEEIIDSVTNGSGTITHNSNSRDISLANVATGTGDNAGLYSYNVPYTPGNSQLVAITGTLDNASIGSGTAQLFLRSNVTGSVVETVVDQTSWNNPVSDVDWTKSQIFEMDFQSLKVGRIRFYLNRNGITTPIHELHNDNVRSTGYWQLPNLPLSWRIYNDATYTYMEMGYGDANNGIGIRYRIAKNVSATLRAICGTVKSEGGQDLTDIQGYSRSADMGVTELTVGATLIPLISIRPKTTFNSITNLGLSVPIGATVIGDNPMKVAIIHNNTLTGASWTDVDSAESSMEYDTSATALTNGHIVQSGYLGSNKNTTISGESLLGKTLLWNRLGTESGILTIAAIRTTTTSSDALASINWKEIR